jgi:hypothetical protein
MLRTRSVRVVCGPALLRPCVLLLGGVLGLVKLKAKFKKT